MKKILFIDDDQNLLDGLQRAMRKKKDQWDMTFLSNAQEGLDIINSGAFDAVITDYRMPGLNGLELLKKVKESNPQVKRILLSGQSEQEVFDEASGVAHEYISKPCDFDKMIEILDKNLK